MQQASRDLGQFIDAELCSRLLPGALAVNGPAVAIDTRACAVLAPVLHEIAASSITVPGSDASDQTVISWACDDSGCCVIECKFADGRCPVFSSSASNDIDFDVCNDRIRIALPAQYLASGNQTSVSSAATSLHGQTVLVVEDQLIIALDLEMLLRQQGASQVHVVGTADEALALIATAAPDISVLDVNLGSSTSFPVAKELLRLGVPFIFATGYGKEADFPAEFQAVPLVGKPYCPKAIRDAIAISRMRSA
ncbi:response regulator [Leptospira interrogans]